MLRLFVLLAVGSAAEDLQLAFETWIEQWFCYNLNLTLKRWSCRNSLQTPAYTYYKIQVGELYRLLRSGFLDLFFFSWEMMWHGVTSNKGVCRWLNWHHMFHSYSSCFTSLLCQSWCCCAKSLGMRLCASKEFIHGSKYTSYVSLKSSPELWTFISCLDFDMISNTVKKLCVLAFTFGTGLILRTWMMIAEMSSLVRMG